MIKSLKVNEKDYINYSTYAVKRICQRQKNNGSVFVKNMIVWFITTLVFMFIFRLDSTNLSAFHWPSATIAAFPFAVFIVAYVINTRKFRQLSIPNANGLMLGEKTIEFTDAGITEITLLGMCFYKWECVDAVEENNGDLYIFMDKLLALIIPSASFSSDAEKTDLQALLKKYVQQGQSTTPVTTATS